MVKQSQGPTSPIKSRPRLNASVVSGFMCVNSGACVGPALPRPLLFYGTSSSAQGPGPRLSASREEREGPRGRGRTVIYINTFKPATRAKECFETLDHVGVGEGFHPPKNIA